MSLLAKAAKAESVENFEDRAEAVRRALSGLAGSKKSNFGFENSSHKQGMSMHSPAPLVSAPVSQIPLQNATNTLSRNQSKDTPKSDAAKQVPVVLKETSMRATETCAPAYQPLAATVSKAGCTNTTKDAQELLYQLRRTENQPISALQSHVAPPDVALQPTKSQGQIRRNSIRDMGRSGKKKTEVEKENDKLLDELEALGEPAVEIPGETPVEENQRLRREATAAMLKHSFFMRPRHTPPASRVTTASGSEQSFCS